MWDFQNAKKIPRPCAPKGGPHESYGRVGALASFPMAEMLRLKCWKYGNAEMFLVRGVEIIAHYSGNLHQFFS